MSSHAEASLVVGRSVGEIIGELHSLIGLESVKREVQSLVSLMCVNVKRVDAGLAPSTFSNHLVFTGPPGTGKTNVARLYAELLGAVGALEEGHLIEVTRQDLVGEYIGQTAIKTGEVLDKAKGGVLFIDEAYTLAPNDPSRDFGPEAVATLLKRMEDDRDGFALIVAGYHEEMNRFIESNPGLASRFGQTLEFPSHSLAELKLIFEGMVESAGLRLTNGAKTAAVELLGVEQESSNGNFGNARAARRLLESAVRRQAVRIVRRSDPSRTELSTICKSDLQENENSRTILNPSALERLLKPKVPEPGSFAELSMLEKGDSDIPDPQLLEALDIEKLPQLPPTLERLATSANDKLRLRLCLAAARGDSGKAAENALRKAVRTWRCPNPRDMVYGQLRHPGTGLAAGYLTQAHHNKAGLFPRRRETRRYLFEGGSPAANSETGHFPEADPTQADYLPPGLVLSNTFNVRTGS